MPYLAEFDDTGHGARVAFPFSRVEAANVNQHMRSALMITTLFASVVACSSGGSSDPTAVGEGGDSGSADGAGPQDAASSDNPNACPSSAPSEGSACTLPSGTSCTYGRCGIVTSGTCTGGHWSISRAGVLCASDAGNEAATVGDGG